MILLKVLNSYSQSLLSYHLNQDKKMKKFFFPFLLVLGCTSTPSSHKIGGHDNCNTLSNVMTSSDSVLRIQKSIDIGGLFGVSNYSVKGIPTRIDSLIRIDYDNAITANDTLIIVTREDKVSPIFDFRDIRKPATEEQLKDIMKECRLIKTVDDSEMKYNTDGDYEIPYLFFINALDSIQYMITMPNKKPYTYEFCEARFDRKSQNYLAKRLFSALSKFNVDVFASRHPHYKYIWFIQTDNSDSFHPEEQKHEWSIFVRLEKGKTKTALLTIDYEAILNNDSMKMYL